MIQSVNVIFAKGLNLPVESFLDLSLSVVNGVPITSANCRVKDPLGQREFWFDAAHRYIVGL